VGERKNKTNKQTNKKQRQRENNKDLSYSCGNETKKKKKSIKPLGVSLMVRKCQACIKE
jgi:hypothetical protein